MSADQPDDPTAIDRPPNAREGSTLDSRPNAEMGVSPSDDATTPPDRRVPVTAVEDVGRAAALVPRPSIPARQAALQETRIAVLRARVAALEHALEAERDQRRAIVNQYERILAERERTERGALDDPSFFDRLRGLLSP